MDPQRQRRAAEALLALHRDRAGFILPNAWDAGSAIVLASEGFAAVATTSAGIAFSLGLQDYWVDDAGLGLDRDATLARAAEIARAVRAPVSADLEAGFGDAPQAVAETVVLALQAGLAGGNIEDKRPQLEALYDEDLAVARIAAARAALDRLGGVFVLNARTDAFLVCAPDALETAVRRANRFLAAGADCVFVPGPTDVATARTLAARIEGPVNLVIGLGDATADARALLAVGVRRISVGGSIARAALALVRRAAVELRDRGTASYAEGQMSGRDFGALVAAAQTGS